MGRFGEIAVATNAVAHGGELQQRVQRQRLGEQHFVVLCLDVSPFPHFVLHVHATVALIGPDALELQRDIAQGASLASRGGSLG